MKKRIIVGAFLAVLAVITLLAAAPVLGVIFTGAAAYEVSRYRAERAQFLPSTAS